MNILTFDIEEWYLEKKYFGNHADRYKEYDSYLDQILEKLDDKKIIGTFFCVGGMATDFPEIVKRIETELEYPGQIKISLIRETRAVDYAK